MPHQLRFVGFVSLLLAVAWTPSHARETPAWLERVNFYRAEARLPTVSEDPMLSRADWQHARYMVMHNEVKHSENPRDTWATPEGAAAAAVSNLAASTRFSEPDEWAVDVWMQAPFHAIGILDPALKHVGFGIFHADKEKLQSGAGLDVIRGRQTTPVEAHYPIVWPANGASVPLSTFASEYPNPLTSCGYNAPAGLPLIVQLGSGADVPHVTRTSIAEGNNRVEHCVFDESTYRNHNAVDQKLGRSILAARNAIVLIPRRPLKPGARYRVTIETNGRVIDWTFTVGGDAR